MKVKIRRRQNSYFNLRAVSDGENAYSGVVMINSSGTKMLKGISCFFQRNDNDNTLLLGRDKLFFYGGIRQLRANFNGERYLGIDSRSFVDKTGGRYLASNDHRGTESEYFMIPYDELKLEKSRERLVSDLLKRLEEDHLQLFRDQIKVDLKSDDFEIRSFNRDFNLFPEALREQATEDGFYFKNKVSETAGTQEEIDVKPPRIFYTAIGGVPDWAKKIWKRH
ncbi:hypothetical protein CMI42_03105 [Candidatus Pacearchaeota archaeon]|nr:hypothetical protein [Candidatus Pacearchaeota archaeon]|tara:strand:- start:1377 stop:2045 length:669 start_codon:yes stop_codon:yes gene_type:complete